MTDQINEIDSCSHTQNILENNKKKIFFSLKLRVYLAMINAFFFLHCHLLLCIIYFCLFDMIVVVFSKKLSKWHTRLARQKLFKKIIDFLKHIVLCNFERHGNNN